jgi:hypothetical protein
MRLEAPGLCSLHFLADDRNRVGAETFRGELALGQQCFDRADIDDAVDLAEQFSFHVGPVAVADRDSASAKASSGSLVHRRR